MRWSTYMWRCLCWWRRRWWRFIQTPVGHHTGEMLLAGCCRRFIVGDGFAEWGWILWVWRPVGAVFRGIVDCRPFAVLSAVPPQHSGAGETLPASTANVGFLSSVWSYVPLQIPWANETLPCSQRWQCDLERKNQVILLLLGCNSEVLALTTRGTAVRFFPWVASFVLQKFPVCVKGFSTLVTRECLVCGVSPLVLFEITQVIKSWESVDNTGQCCSKTCDPRQ